MFLHADLQKKLIKLLSAKQYRQTIVATHSLEMISDVAPAEIVLVSKRSQRSRPLSSSAQAQGVVEAIGTNLNIQLSKVAMAGKIIFVEGKDYGFLDQIAFKMGNVFYDKFSRIPHFSVGGMNNWPRAAMASKAFNETSAGKVEGVMFIDRDYKPDNIFEGICEDAAKDSLRLVTWSKKEIENYFLDAKVIHSYLCRQGNVVDFKDIEALILQVVDKLFLGLPVMIADGIQMSDRKISLPTAMERAADIIQDRLQKGAHKRDLIGGKKAISMISESCQNQWGMQISSMSLCRHISLNDVPFELCDAVVSLV